MNKKQFQSIRERVLALYSSELNQESISKNMTTEICISDE
jgi:hypothetical protein